MVSATPAVSPAPIVAFANTRWTASLWMNRQHLLSRIAALGWPVLYSNGVSHYRNFTSVPLRQTAVVRDRVHVMKPGFFIPATYRSSPLRSLAMSYHCRLIHKVLRKTGNAPFVGLCFDPDLIDHVDALAPRLRMFHIYDAYNKMDSGYRDFAPIRARIGTFDLVTASSSYMYEEVMNESPDPHLIIPNGVDYEAVLIRMNLRSPTAEAIRALPGPRIGYVGSINTKIDFGLVSELAAARPSHSFVFVGPVREAILQRNPRDLAAYQALRDRRNVHFFGAVSRHEVASVMAAMDVNCIYLHHTRRDWVEVVYPIKLNEYLAVGKPVVSTPIRVVQNEFRDVVVVCEGAEEWLLALDVALASDDDATLVASRRRVAASNDWENRARHMIGLIEAALN